MNAMREDLYYKSCGAGKIHACHWPVEEPRAVLQIVHGIGEHVLRYDEMADYLNGQGIAVVAEDHMGHGESIADGGIRGYFHGGWFSAVDDSKKLMDMTREMYPGVPYILFGHSMGSFMVRTMLARFPDMDLAGCVICGTGWQPEALLAVAIPLCKFYCRNGGDKKANKTLHKLMFGNYNNRVEHLRTESDWLTRDDRIVDAYIRDPLCGFIPTAGLSRDMLMGISHIQKKETLERMNKKLPCFFIAGGDDPVGDYGKRVLQTVDAFRKAGMEQVRHRIYPLARHEIHNEINRYEVFEDLVEWIDALV